MVYNGSVSPLLLPPVGLIQEFHTLAVKTAPVVAVKERMQGLAEDPRRLLEKVLKLFAQVHCVQYTLLQCIVAIHRQLIHLYLGSTVGPMGVDGQL